MNSKLEMIAEMLMLVNCEGVGLTPQTLIHDCLYFMEKSGLDRETCCNVLQKMVDEGIVGETIPRPGDTDTYYSASENGEERITAIIKDLIG